MITILENATELTLFGEQQNLQKIVDALKVDSPTKIHTDSYQLWRQTDGREGWDGFVRPVRMMGRAARAARGHLDDVLRVIEENGFDYTKDKLLPRPFEQITTDDIPDNLIRSSFLLDEFQRECIAQWLKHGIGVNKVTVSGGKTATYCAAGAFIKRKFPKTRFLYITQSERLVNQVFTSSREFLPDWNITQYGGGKKNNTGTDMVVATIAMIWRNRGILSREEFFGTFDGIFFDESHHAVSETAEKILLHLTATFRFGASDSTKSDDPVAHAKIKGLLGPVRNIVSAAPLIERGRIARPEIYVVDVKDWQGKFNDIPHQAEKWSTAWALIDGEWKQGSYLGPVEKVDQNGKIEMEERRVLLGAKLDAFGQKTGDWEVKKVPVMVPGLHKLLLDDEEVAVDSTWCLLDRVYDRAIIRFKERNNLIAQWVKHYTDQGFPTLVVCTRTLHIVILQTAIEKLVDPERVKILYADHSTRQRNEAFDWIRQTPGSVLISPLAKEGVSINEIKAGVIADYVASWEVANQLIGRYIRPKQNGNSAHITMFVDRQHSSYRRGSFDVIRNLEKIRGYTFYHPVSDPDSLLLARKYACELA